MYINVVVFFIILQAHCNSIYCDGVYFIPFYKIFKDMVADWSKAQKTMFLFNNLSPKAR